MVKIDTFGVISAGFYQSNDFTIVRLKTEPKLRYHLAQNLKFG